MDGPAIDDQIVALMREYLGTLAGADRFAAEFEALIGTPVVDVPYEEPPFAFMTDTDWPSLASTASRALVAAVSDRMGALPWHVPYRSDPSIAGPGFADRAMSTVRVGPHAPVRAEAFASGIFVMGPDVTYFDHKHEPAELYLPISGMAEFWNEDRGWYWAVADDVTIHPSWQWHAMRTGPQPVMIFWAWLGPEGFGTDPVCRPAMAGEAA